MIRAALLLTALTCSSCMNVELEIQQPNPAVKPILKGRACDDIYFGIGSAKVTFADAMRQGIPSTDFFDNYSDGKGYTQIRTLHSAIIVESASSFLIPINTYCLKVTGEP